MLSPFFPIHSYKSTIKPIHKRQRLWVINHLHKTLQIKCLSRYLAAGASPEGKDPGGLATTYSSPRLILWPICYCSTARGARGGK